ncbi:MAG: hypothetical protein ACJA2S_000298 [Cyclobacteriaceae bacterium]|jgi:hypothetical protein
MAPELSTKFGEGFFWEILFLSIPFGIGIAYFLFGLILPSLVKFVGRIWNGSSTAR